MNKFHIGDRVIGCGRQSAIDITGMTGTIVKESPSSAFRWRVEFDEPHSRFHSCDGWARNKHGWNCSDDVIELYVEPEEFEAPCLDGLFD